MKVKLVKKVDEAKLTKSFYFESEEPVTWQAGQYFYITLPKLNYPDERGDTRHFTISGSPTEGGTIRITTRVRQESGYKKTLDELPIGTEMEGKGPNGLFTFPPDHNSKVTNLVFIAGGIGITPFRSMIKYAVDKNITLPIKLLYSNSDSEFVFKNELDTWSEANQNLKIEYLDTSVSGRIDKLKLEKFIHNSNLKIENCTWWVVGPPPFVNAIEEILEELKIEEDNVKTEKFTGY
jgi:ferredoxin-NADP reductase